MLSRTLAITLILAVGLACITIGVMMKDGFFIGVGIVCVIIFGWLLKVWTRDDKPAKVTCNGCGKTREEKGGFALLIGENRGLCRDCLEEYLPLMQKAAEENKKREERKCA